MPGRPSRLKRPLVPISPDIRAALHAAHLSDAYAARPPYQRNDYLAWVERAVHPETRERRLGGMLDELAAAHGYMRLPWRPRSP